MSKTTIMDGWAVFRETDVTDIKFVCVHSHIYRKWGDAFSKWALLQSQSAEFNPRLQILPATFVRGSRQAVIRPLWNGESENETV